MIISLFIDETPENVQTPCVERGRMHPGGGYPTAGQPAREARHQQQQHRISLPVKPEAILFRLKPEATRCLE
jgi:hypothetical protein